MALQSSGQISFSQIMSEFGVGGSLSISQFYKGGGIVPNVPRNANVPTSGAIYFSSFWSATSVVPQTLAYGVGNHTWTWKKHNLVQFRAWGAGGGGGGGQFDFGGAGGAGSAGADTFFNGVSCRANGGAGGAGAFLSYSSTRAADGTMALGDYGVTGGGQPGGIGGSYGSTKGQDGGYGGYAQRTYNVGSISGSVSLTVGTGGSGGPGGAFGTAGQNGYAEVYIE